MKEPYSLEQRPGHWYVNGPGITFRTFFDGEHAVVFVKSLNAAYAASQAASAVQGEGMNRPYRIALLLLGSYLGAVALMMLVVVFQSLFWPSLIVQLGCGVGMGIAWARGKREELAKLTASEAQS